MSRQRLVRATKSRSSDKRASVKSEVTSASRRNAYAFERAANPLYGTSIHTKALRYLTHALGAARRFESGQDLRFQLWRYLRPMGAATRRMSPPEDAKLKHGGEFTIAGVVCIDWSWMDDTELHTACLTPDGVLLRLLIDGKIVAEARSVVYAPQPPELFEIPPGYEPALAPEGGPGD